MKKRFLKGSLLTLAVTLISIAEISAATSIYSNTSYSLNAGATKTLTSKLHPYTGAEAEITPFTATSGTKKTTMKVYRGTSASGSTIYNTTKTFSTTTCTYFDMGTLQPAGLTFVNSASGFVG